MIDSQSGAPNNSDKDRKGRRILGPLNTAPPNSIPLNEAVFIPGTAAATVVSTTSTPLRETPLVSLDVGFTAGGRLSTNSLGDIYRVQDIHSVDDLYNLSSSLVDKERETAKSQEPSSDTDPEPDPAIEREIFEYATRPITDTPPQAKRARRVTRARTSIGRAVLKNQVQLALSSEALLVLIDEKLRSLRDQRHNSDEAISVRNEAIAYHEGLRDKLITFRDSTFAFLAGEVNEKPLVESAKSFRNRISEQFLTHGLFLLSSSISIQAGAEPSFAIAVCGALAGGRSVVDVVKAWFSKA